MRYVHIILYALLASWTECSQLLTSYLPASMQALAYYIDLLQYEPLSMTTIEPPFVANDLDLSNEPTKSPMAISRPPNAINQSSWITQNFWGAITTSTPVIRTTTTTTRRPPSTTMSSSSSVWWKPPTISAPASSTTKHPWFTISTTAKSTTKPPPSRTTTSYPTTIRTTRKTTASWWSYSTLLTKQPITVKPTESHRPGLFAPYQYSHRNNIIGDQLPEKAIPYHAFNDIGDYPDDMGTLTFSLIRDIQSELDYAHFSNDVELLDNFMRLYDDNYGRATVPATDPTHDPWPGSSSTGKKRIPPTKPYVEFLLVYDLLKRDAKSSNLSKYEGYSEEMLKELHELSNTSAQRQLYTLLKRMLDRGDVERNDVVQRLRSILKDLGNPDSITSRSLRHIPTLQFIP